MSDEGDPLLEASWRLQAGYPREALETLREASPVDMHVAFVRARALTDLGRFGEAENEARRGLELEPENVDLLETLAAVQLNSDAKAAEATLRKAMELTPENPRLFALYVFILMEQGRFEWAEKMLERLIRIAPDDELTLRVRTMFMLRASASGEARDAAQTLLGEYPDEAFAHYIHGLALLSGPWWRGLRHLRQAAAMRPQEPALAETARVMGSWYLLPVHLTGGVKHFVFVAAFVGYILIDGAVNGGMSTTLWVIFWAFIAYKWIAHFVATAVLGRRVARALRDR